MGRGISNPSEVYGFGESGLNRVQLPFLGLKVLVTWTQRSRLTRGWSGPDSRSSITLRSVDRDAGFLRTAGGLVLQKIPRFSARSRTVRRRDQDELRLGFTSVTLGRVRPVCCVCGCTRLVRVGIGNITFECEPAPA